MYDGTPLKAAVHHYRTLRKRETPESALQQLHTLLLSIAAGHAVADEPWLEIDFQSLAALVYQHLSLLQMRSGIDTARERFWVTGRLSKSTDHILFVKHINGNRYWYWTCRDLACAIKHGVGAFEFPEWSEFSVERPNGEVLLTVTDRSTTIEQAFQMAKGD